MNEIFRYNKLPRKKDIIIDDFKEVVGHFIYDNEMYYKFKINRSEHEAILRLDDCFSFDLFESIRNYLLNDTSKKTQDIAESTKYSEIYGYFQQFKVLMNPEITLKQLTSSGCTNRSNRRKTDPKIDNIIDKYEDIVDVFQTCDNIIGVSVNNGKDKLSYDLQEFEFYCKSDVYKKLKSKIPYTSQSCHPLHFQILSFFEGG